jgi:heme-degrading monooxygenase HmoA
LTLSLTGRTVLSNTDKSFPPLRSRRVPFTPSQRKERSMFTRIVELTTKPGKNKQLSDTINDKVMPILKKQKGFVDETVLISDKDDNRVLGLSFWSTKEDAEQYHRTEYPKVQETLRPLLDAEPVIRTYEVHTSTTHRIAAGKAA